jgi:predicted MPP superfamily phosphohydrolase
MYTTRRTFFSTVAFGLLGLGSYACGIEPLYRLIVKRYDLALPRWPVDAKPLKIALVADVHAVDPWMGTDRIREIVDTTNALAPDIILLLGDYMGATRLRTHLLRPEEWAVELGRLTAPLGSYAILGNHDYSWSGGAKPVTAALEAVGIPVLANDAHRITADGHDFWLTGTDSMLTGPEMGYPRGPGIWKGRDDIKATIAKTDASAPIIHMAHEPDMFPHVPDHVALTLSGHTHGGQVWLPILGRPMVTSTYGQTYAYGHVVKDDRHIVISGGLGCSHLPIRFGVPPEIVLLDVKSA